MKPTVNPPVRPLITPEQMQRILDNRRPITSAEAHRQMLVHLGRLPAKDIQPTQDDAPARADARPDTIRSESHSNPLF
jgi:hypothetical protein